MPSLFHLVLQFKLITIQELKMENQQTEEDIVRLKAKLSQLRDALEMRGHQHQNGIDKEVSKKMNFKI